MGTRAVLAADGRTRAAVTPAPALMNVPVFDFTIGQGDQFPAIQAVLRDQGNAVVDLTNATSVQLVMVKDVVRVTGTCSIVGAPVNGTVSYAWGANDTAVFGAYDAQFVVTWNTGAPETYPNNAPLVVQVTKRA